MATFSSYAILGVIPWLLLSPFQYGYAISELNQVQQAISCETPNHGKYGLTECIPMDDATFGLVTSIFTIGGLLSSMFANQVMDPYGRKTAVQINAIAVAIGSLFITTASSVGMLILGRFFVGLGAGLGLCVIPAFLSEISPPSIRDSVGLLNQLSVVFGILVTQVLGFNFATPGSWRTVFVVSFALAVLQFVMGLRMVESPAWLAARNRKPEARAVSARLWKSSNDGDHAHAHSHGGAYEDDDAEEALLRDRSPLPQPSQPPATVGQCFRIPELRRPLIIVSLAMLAQQISGINAVMFYSTSILSTALPKAASYVSLAVTVINVIMTFPPIFLIERVGQRKILLYSVIGSIVSLLVLGFSLNQKITSTSTIATLTFVSCFAFGLGPIPFIIIPDVSPLYAVSALASIALSINWLVNFIVGLTFLPLRNYLRQGGESDGNVFYLFALLFTATSFAFFKYF